MNRFLLILTTVCLVGIGTVNAQKFSTHNVKNGETIEALAKRYGVTVTALYKLNPDAKDGLKPNTILIIPTAQDASSKLTETKELIGFKKHKTKKKETLYGLAKQYGVTEAEIKKHNTFLYAENLRKGDKLQIPVFKVKKQEIEQGPQTYTVKSKEGKWRIAYKYGITIAELEALNPEMGAVLKEGQKINVPNIDAAEEKIIDEEQYSYYRVLPKEGFYRLKLKLNLDQEALEALNPELKEGGLKAGMILKVPFSEKAEGEKLLEVTDLSSQITNFNTKRIALMLPFKLNKVEFDSILETRNHIEKDPYLDVSLDFYSGVLTALDSLKHLGVSVTLDVYDTRNETTTVSRLVGEKVFEATDAVIGPLNPKSFDIVSKTLKSRHVPVVSPIGTNLQLYDNVFQSRPSDELLKTKIVKFIKSDSLPKHILIVSDSKNKATAEYLMREFNAANVVYSRKDKKGKDENYVMVDDIKSGLKPGRNVVFLETQNEGFASNVTSVLASLHQNANSTSSSEVMDIVLATTRFNRAFEGDEINNSHLSKLQFHFAAISKSYSDEEQNTFVNIYDKTYNVTPSRAAIKGFDLMMDVVLRLATSEDLYLSTDKFPLTSYVEHKFAYKKKPFGGYFNDAVYLVKYDNLRIVQVEN